MTINCLTIFPEMFDGFICHSVMGRAVKNRLVEITCYNFRDFSTDKHGRVDDYPFGGGAGMVIAPQPVMDCFAHIKKNSPGKRIWNIYMSPKGKPLRQDMLKPYLGYDAINILCGHYEGVDQRIIDTCIDEELSIGDYVLTGGELPAMVFMDALIRLIPGVLGNAESKAEESFSQGVLEYPQYTRPAEFRGLKVPDVLLSGNHRKIEAFRREKSREITREKRPDLLK